MVWKVHTMRETLEVLYYGNITPYDRQIRSGTSLMKALESVYHWPHPV